jgi:hypothetical protein
MGGPSQYGNAATFAAPPPVDYVNGSSNLWELPLTLRYDFAKNQKTKFFANAGFSSYFIMKQTNIYFFHNGQRSAAWKATDNEQINYWFGVADISLGLETAIGKGFFISKWNLTLDSAQKYGRGKSETEQLWISHFIPLFTGIKQN